MSAGLNARAREVAEAICRDAETLLVEIRTSVTGARVVDCGINAEGGLQAGRALADVCLSGLAEVSLIPHELDGSLWPHVAVTTDFPVEACLFSQYAGWQISLRSFFAMGSGPVRAAMAQEEMFERLAYHETADCTVAVLETAQLPDDSVVRYVAEAAGVSPANTILFVAPTSSQAGSFQVVARSVETALHKLFELDFDVRRIRSASGIAPLPPVAPDDLTGIGLTNDAILYGASVTLWVTGDDETLSQIGPHVPSSSSACYGQPFLEVFEAAGRDFYQIDPLLFSPAQITFQNLDTGRVHRFGKTAPAILHASFGL